MDLTRALEAHPVWRAAILAICLTSFGERQVLSQVEDIHRFQIPADALAYPNELLWDYSTNQVQGDAETQPGTGEMPILLLDSTKRTNRPLMSRRRVPPPTYALHCFVVARTARQFFDHALFKSNEPRATHAEYRHLIELVLARSPRSSDPDREKIVIPGYASLREFSRDFEDLLKSESGGAWQSYFQRGNWRMVFPFSRRHQEKTERQLAAALDRGEPPIVHLVCFPALTLNHVLLVFNRVDEDRAIRFLAYDPNQPDAAASLVYDRVDRRFLFPRNHYFAGGPVKVYEIYRGWFY